MGNSVQGDREDGGEVNSTREELRELGSFRAPPRSGAA